MPKRSKRLYYKGLNKKICQKCQEGKFNDKLIEIKKEILKALPQIKESFESFNFSDSSRLPNSQTLQALLKQIDELTKITNNLKNSAMNVNYFNADWKEGHTQCPLYSFCIPVAHPAPQACPYLLEHVIS